MKKLILFLLSFVCISVLADEVKPLNYTKAPEWTDFCETGYENAVYKQSSDLFNIFSFVKAERAKKNYWAQRRESFEKYLKTCNELSDNAKSACYDDLKRIENEKNSVYKIQREHLLYETNMERHKY